MSNMAKSDLNQSNAKEYRGPLKKRSCTDIPCLQFFLLFMIAWAVLGYYALKYGDVDNLLIPRDSQGRKCGVDVEVVDKPYLFFFDLTKCITDHCRTPQVCQSKCPQSSWILNSVQNDDEIRESLLCVNNITVTNKSRRELLQLIQMKMCAEWYLESAPVLRRCVPMKIDFDIIKSNKTKELLSKAAFLIDHLNNIEGIFQKIVETRGIVMVFICGSLVICILYIILLRWFALPCVITAIITLVGLLSYLSYLSYLEWNQEDSWRGWLILTITLGVIAGTITLFTICLFNRIRLACQLIAEAGRAVIQVLSTVIFPIFPWLLKFGIFVWFIYTGFYLYSIEDSQYIIDEKFPNNSCLCTEALNYTNGSLCDPQKFIQHCRENNEQCISKSCRLNHSKSPSFIKYLYIIHISGFIWSQCFITAMSEMILAATFATWYWTMKKSNVPWFTITVSTWRTLRYHIGTIAFGSLLITICELFKLLLQYLHKKTASTNGCCGLSWYIKRYCQCFVSVIEKFLKFMNRNAYIICAISGKGLCKSAAIALSLLMRNCMRTLVLNSVVDYLIFFGKIAVTSAMTAVSWWYFKHYSNEFVENKEFWWAPVTIIAIGTYFTATAFFTVYASAVSTIFLCFLDDSERNDGSREKPYCMSRRLGKILNVRNK